MEFTPVSMTGADKLHRYEKLMPARRIKRYPSTICITCLCGYLQNLSKGATFVQRDSRHHQVVKSLSS